jgi:CDP-diacylglycerol--serine O-phosphatidyltransferase
VPPEMVGPLIVVLVLSIALLVAYPWVLLTAGTLAYLACLPFGWLSYRAHERRSLETKPEGVSAAGTATVGAPPLMAGLGGPAEDDDRPSRLN